MKIARLTKRLTPIQWAKAAAESPGGWEYAHRLAVVCWQITPLDAFWVNALNWLNNRKQQYTQP